MANSPFKTHFLLILLLFSIITGFIVFQVSAKNEYTQFKIIRLRIPEHFEPIRWSGNKIYGLQGTQFIEYDPSGQTWRIIHPDTWAVAIDKRGKFLAFSNDTGLNYIDLTEGQIILIGRDLRAVPHFWSEDSRYLLYSCGKDYYIYDRIMNKSTRFKFRNVENFLSEPVSWVQIDGKSQLLFILRFSCSKKGEREYRKAGYRAELYRANIKGEFTPLVEVEDGQYVIFDGLNTDTLKGYYHLFNEEGNIVEINLKTGEMEKSWDFKDCTEAVITGGEEFALLKKENLELINLKNNKTLHSFSFEFKRMYSSPEHSKVLVLPSTESDLSEGYLLEIN